MPLLRNMLRPLLHASQGLHHQNAFYFNAKSTLGFRLRFIFAKGAQNSWN